MRVSVEDGVLGAEVERVPEEEEVVRVSEDNEVLKAEVGRMPEEEVVRVSEEEGVPEAGVRRVPKEEGVPSRMLESSDVVFVSEGTKEAVPMVGEGIPEIEKVLRVGAGGQQEAEGTITVRRFSVYHENEEEEVRRRHAPQFIQGGGPRQVERVRNGVERIYVWPAARLLIRRFRTLTSVFTTSLLRGLGLPTI
ncbi:uncharacterized protein LOC111382009 [Olea europaea var. sylvestris]|uniref:uncharacterized protein LOC111382009 n=1 Tax=Olea europaea var. sylvestris TaxID=158386 RepID=UPI000C1D140E|nr:uncharacterized protein LOC111382009 [Olea europaea var. sylvestris]XP_022861635.1 uncharacterized protein LOC111382009 [Olea europaea var. sylvestris]XP_022861636.1 uncharacterized protein LOC111382009 [Olea europaea var. sylvestris]